LPSRLFEAGKVGAESSRLRSTSARRRSRLNACCCRRRAAARAFNSARAVATGILPSPASPPTTATKATAEPYCPAWFSTENPVSVRASAHQTFKSGFD